MRAGTLRCARKNCAKKNSLIFSSTTRDLFIWPIARRVAPIQLQPVERTLARQRFAFVRRTAPLRARHLGASAQQRPQRIKAQRVVVIHIFVPQRQAKDALLD
jgi:hypothetical protein